MRVQRIAKLSKKDKAEFFENGFGRRVLPQDSLVVLLSSSTQSTHSNVAKLQPMAVGVIAARRDAYKEVSTGGPRTTPSLEVGVTFRGASMATVVRLLSRGGMQYSKGSSLAAGSYLLCSSGGFFTYEPALQSLKEMDSVPLGDTLVHLKSPVTPPALAHGGLLVSELSDSIQAAVQSDPAQKDALQLMLDSRVVLVQVRYEMACMHRGFEYAFLCWGTIV